MGSLRRIAVVLSVLVAATGSVVLAAEKAGPGTLPKRSAPPPASPSLSPAPASTPVAPRATDAPAAVKPVVKPTAVPSLPPGIEILTPRPGDQWPKGEQRELRWRVSGIPADPKRTVRVRMTSFDWSPVYDVTKDVPMTGTYMLDLTTYPGAKTTGYTINASIVDPATNKRFESAIDITIGSPWIEILNLAELTAAPWAPGKSYKVLWKKRGGTGYTPGVTIAISDAASGYPYLSSTSDFYGGTGTYEWKAKAFAKKLKFSITPKDTGIAGASFLFDVDTGKYPTISPTLTAPSAPVLSARLFNYKQSVELKWEDTSGNEKEFVVERKHAGAAGPYGEIGRVPMNGTSYQDKAVPSPGPYRYRVRAVNENGSAASNEVDIATSPPKIPADLTPVNPNLSIGPAGYCPPGGYSGTIDVTIRNLGPGTADPTNAVLFVWNKQTSGLWEEVKTATPVLKKGDSFVWHATATKCLGGEGKDCEFNLMINYNPNEIIETDMSTNDIYFTCAKIKEMKVIPGILPK
jgi:hypothetical protein